MRHAHSLFVAFVLCATSLLAQEGQIVFHPAAGDYLTSQQVRIEGGAAGAIFYTLNGSAPGRQSQRYTGTPIALGKSQVLRVAVFGAEGQLLQSAGASYLIGEPPSQLLTVSVGIDPWRLFNSSSGWFMPGDTAGNPDPRAANWWTRREHPAHVDLLETEGQVVHSGTLGLRMFGGISRAHPQKSFSLSGRESYGNKRIDYPLFGPEGNDDFRFLVVRNGGSDWGRSYLRDALLTGLLQDPSWDLDHQAARPVRVYLNGQYWGLYHLREKINPRFLADHHDGVDKDSLSLLEHRVSVKHGRSREYEELHRFITTHDLSEPAHYAHLAQLMDIDNFQRLQIAQTYFDNRDAGGNIRYWRPDGPDEQFRWILYDVDQGFGLHRQEGWKINTLQFNTDPAGPQWPNPPWSTLFQRQLLRNTDYRRSFVNRTLDYLHTDFSAEAVLERTEAAIASVTEEMPRQLSRWDGRMDHWQYHIEQLRQFARYRPTYLREHLREYFGGGPDREVSLTAGLGGYIELNENIQVGSDGLSGRYFVNFPLRLRAVPAPGYHFVGWRGVDATDPLIDLKLGENKAYTIEATFAPAAHPLAEQIVVNEVCPRSKSSGDWVELYNRSEETVDLEGWFLVDDSERRFYLPATYLDAGEYLVVCRREEKFRATYPEVHNYVAGLPFGFNKEGDRIGLYAADGAYVNAISYDWAHDLPIDTAFTYALALPGLDNTQHRNWVREAGSGTPGTANPSYLQSAIVPRQAYWTRVGIGVAVLVLLAFVRSLHLGSRG